jgi:glycosyltransferase involved in cell wall biosynthesis
MMEEIGSRDSRVLYFSNEENLGIVASRARTLSEARGEYVAVIDSDDYWRDRDKLAKQVVFLDEHPEHVLVGGGVVVVDENGREVERLRLPVTDEEIRREILARNLFAHSAVMYRGEAARRAGGYRPLSGEDRSDSSEDYDLFLRLGRLGRFANLDDFLIGYRKHGGSVTRQKLRKMMAKNAHLVRIYGRDYPRFWPAVFRRYTRWMGYCCVGGWLFRP